MLMSPATVRVAFGVVVPIPMLEPSNTKSAESVTPLAVSKRIRLALYELMVSLRPRKVPLPRPRVEVERTTQLEESPS